MEPSEFLPSRVATLSRYHICQVKFVAVRQSLGDWKKGNITPIFKKDRKRPGKLLASEPHLCM